MTFKLYLGLALSGLPLGALYALQAMGIVLVYRTTKVFTFAQAGLGVLAAFTAADAAGHVPPLVAGVLGVAVAVLAGTLIEVTVRFTRGSIQRTVVTLGWLLALQGLSALAFGLAGTAAKVVSDDQVLSVDSIGWTLDRLQLATIIITLVSGGGLALFLSRTATGTVMRGVSDDPEAARLLGLPVRRVARLSWALGGALAGLSGVLAAPQLNLNPIPLLVLTVEAVAVALVGRLESLPLALAAGFGLAVLQPMVQQAVGPSRQGIPELTALVVALGSLVLRRRRGRADSGGAGLPPAPVRPLPTGRPALVRVAVVVALILGVPYLFGHDGGDALVGIGVWSLAALSLVVLAVVVGQVSICTGAFMGIGGFTAAVATAHGVPYLLALVVGAAVAAVSAALVALPAIRLEPLELAIATISLSFAADSFLFSAPFVVASGKRSIKIPSYFNDLPGASGVAGDRHLAWLVFGLFALVGLAAANLRRGRTGAALTALRSSRAATAAMGFSVASAKLRGFATSGLIAGLAGGLLITHLTQLQEVNGGTQPYDTTASITLLAYAVIGGLGNLPAALVAGFLVELPIILAGSTANNDVTATTTLLSGAVLVAVVVLLPDGIVDGAARLVRSARGGRGVTPPAVPVTEPSPELVGAR